MKKINVIEKKLSFLLENVMTVACLVNFKIHILRPSMKPFLRTQLHLQRVVLRFIQTNVFMVCLCCFRICGRRSWAPHTYSKYCLQLFIIFFLWTDYAERSVAHGDLILLCMFVNFSTQPKTSAKIQDTSQLNSMFVYKCTCSSLSTKSANVYDKKEETIHFTSNFWRVRANTDKNGTYINSKKNPRPTTKMKSHAGNTIDVRSLKMSEKYAKYHTRTHTNANAHGSNIVPWHTKCALNRYANFIKE